MKKPKKNIIKYIQKANHLVFFLTYVIVNVLFAPIKINDLS